MLLPIPALRSGGNWIDGARCAPALSPGAVCAVAGDASAMNEMRRLSFQDDAPDMAIRRRSSVKLVLGCPETFLEPTRRRLRLPTVKRDGRKSSPLSAIRPRRTAFAGVTMAGENRPIAEIRLVSDA
jgi:hypothetical protein